MKRMAALLLTLILLLTALSVPAMADDASSMSEKDLSTLRTWYQNVKKGKAKKLTGDPVYVPKLVVAVFDEDDTPTECSLISSDGEGYRGIPAAWLASSMEEAASIVLIWREGVKIGSYTSGLDCIRTKTQISVIDLTDKGAYEPYTAYSDDPPYSIRYASEAVGDYKPDAAIEELAEKLSALNPKGDKAKYDQAKKLYKAKKYYSASIAFGESLYKDWRKQRNSCVQKWPKNKEVWRNSKVKGSAVKMTIQIKGKDKNTATVVRIFKGSTPASYVFISGNGKATVKLPAGTYTIKSGSGQTWYGTNEFFGKYGAYVTHIFNGSSKTIQLKKNYRYTLTLGASDETTGEGVGSEDESWESFSK